MDIIFETDRLVFRRFTEADAPLVLDLNSDPEVLKYLHEPKLRDEGHAAEIITNIIIPQYAQQLGRWATHIKLSGEFIGWCGLKFRPELNEIDLGYRFKKSSWGKGFASEAAKQTLEYGFTNRKLPIIYGCADIYNIASWKVLEKIGMHFIGETLGDGCVVRKYEKKAVDG